MDQIFEAIGVVTVFTAYLFAGVVVQVLADRRWWGSIERLYERHSIAKLLATATWPVAVPLAIAIWWWRGGDRQAHRLSPTESRQRRARACWRKNDGAQR